MIDPSASLASGASASQGASAAAVSANACDASWDWVLRAAEGNFKHAHQVLQASGSWPASLITDLLQSGAPMPNDQDQQRTRDAWRSTSSF